MRYYSAVVLAPLTVGLPVIGAATVCALSPRPAQAQTQTLTFVENDNTPYSVEKIKEFKPRTNPDGTVTVRVRLTLNYVRIPECYQPGMSVPALARFSKGILGTELGSQDRNVVPLTTGAGGTLVPPPAIAGNAQRDAERLRAELFNAIRTAIPRPAQNGLRNAAITPGANPAAATVANRVNLFAYGDWLYNTRAARDLAFYGTNMISTEAFDDQLKQLSGVLKLVKDPKKPTSTPTAGITETDFRKYSLWFFELAHISPKAGDPAAAAFLNGQMMASVRIVWILEATFKPSKPPAFPLLGQKPTTKSETEAAANQPAGEVQPPAPEKSADDSKAGGGFLPIPGLGNIVESPGIEPVVGWSVQNNGRPTFVGINVVRPVPIDELQDSFKKKTFDFNIKNPFASPRTGFLVGYSNSGNDRNAVLFALSHKVHPLVGLFAGAAIGDVLNNPRFGPVLGVSFNLGRVFSPTPPADNAAQKDYDLVIEKSEKPLQTPCILNTHAALLWETNPQTDMGVLAGQEARYLVRFAQPIEGGETEVYETYVNPPVAVGGNVIPWITWVKPGAIIGVTLQTRNIGSTGPWTDAAPRQIGIINLVPPAGPATAATQIEAGNVYRVTVI
jgi:hypothetical protein